MTEKELFEIISLPKENEWVEFKVNDSESYEIGEYISALTNSACLHNREFGYLIFGIKNTTHEIVGTNFNPKAKKVGNEELENWLATQLNPRIDFKIYEF
ncbi:MAG TPA: ATP-binding protein, partial [Ignavibacteriaceae bacterium]